VQVAGLVVARQRPETARGYTFVLLEDEAGMMNAIVRPDVYERDRIAVRSEPFIQVIGTIARDDGTVNIVAEEIRPLNLGQTDPPTAGTPYQAVERPFSFLKDLRRHAPSSKNWA
jgi:DNA polymerase III alpha subunit